MKLRQDGETPLGIHADVAMFNLECSGNGNPKKSRAQSPNCTIMISEGTKFYQANWQNAPHMTTHCAACRAFYFERQGQLKF